MEDELERMVEEIEKDAGTDISEDEESSEEKDDKNGKKAGAEKKVKLFEERYFEVDNEPPKLVVIQGPPGSGKTTLIRSLVRHYTKQTITDPKGRKLLTKRSNYGQNRKEAKAYICRVPQRYGSDG